MSAVEVRPVEQDADKAGSRVPPLENGDRLTRAEFKRRYEAMPRLKKAELIEGEVHMPSPVRHKSHGQPHAYLMTWVGTYFAATPGVEVSDNATVRLDADNEYPVDWFDLRDERYVSMSPDDRGVLHSRVFPGLRLTVGALLKGDLAGVLAELQKGIGTPEHQAFVEQLTERIAHSA